MPGRKRQRPFRIWCAYDTETSNQLFADGNYYAWPILFIFNDVSSIPMDTYEVDHPDEQVTFLRHEAEAIAYIEDVIDQGKEAACIPVMCVYNAIFDLQPILSSLHELHPEMRVNAQSATNIYTLDVLEADKIVLRIWDTYHLEMRGLSAMGATCGLAKLMGDWDYDLVRTPETPLTDAELGYAARDVQVIPAYLRYLCDAYDWLTPDMLGCRVLTKTSIVRQMARANIGPLKVGKGKNRMSLLFAFESLCKREMPKTFESYATQQATFRGGLTFTAALTASTVVERVYSLDETSAHHAFINGRRVPIGFQDLPEECLDLWMRDIQRYTTYDVLHRYSYPFQRWFHMCIRLRNVRPKEGSAFAAWGIGLLAQAKFNKHVPLRDGDNNMRAVEAMEYLRNQGFVDSAVNPTFAFGKLMRADEATIFVSELEWWCVNQVYDFDDAKPLFGEGTIKSIWPPDYITLQSNTLYTLKNDAKVIANNYDGRHPYALDIPDSVPPGIAEGLRNADFSKEFVQAWYQNATKGAFNSIYGTQAQNVLKADYEVRDDDELAIDRDTRCTPATFDEKVKGIKHPMVLYSYGLRIVGGSRMQLIIAMQLIYEAFPFGVIVTGGDTDSIKVACMEGIEASDILAALEPLHRATTDAIHLCMTRLRETFPQLTADLTGVGCFELEPATKAEPAYSLHLEAWNKARVSIDESGGIHVTCAGLSRPANAYHIGIWMRDMLKRGHDVRELLPRALGYNVTVQNEVCHALEHTKPLFRDVMMARVTDYLGNESLLNVHQSIALYDTNRRLGDLMKTANLDNVNYLHDTYGRDVSRGDKIITVEYDYVLAMAVMGTSHWDINIWRYIVDNLATPKLYVQTIEGMEAIA